MTALQQSPETATRHPGYAISQRIRKRIEAAFGWAKPHRRHRQAQGQGPRQGRHRLHLSE
jgi:hypothetical protein